MTVECPKCEVEFESDWGGVAHVFRSVDHPDINNVKQSEEYLGVSDTSPV